MERIYDVIVIGGGPGGFSAALYATRAGLDTLVLEKMSPGGQMTQTHQIDNYPGFDQGVGGYELGEKMRAGAERFGAVTHLAQVSGVELAGDIKRVETGKGQLLARTVIVATGADHKHLGLPEEAGYVGQGVSYCAACDGMFYRGKTVAVVGGGNSAAADALALSRLCQQVIMIHRRDTLRATKIYHQQLSNAGNVRFLWNSKVTGVSGENQVARLAVQDVNTGKTTAVDVDGLFISIGRTPATQMFQGQLALDSQGYIVADETTQTSLPGVFAVGDVRTKSVRQVVTAAADGAVAAHYAEAYLAQKV